MLFFFVFWSQVDTDEPGTMRCYAEVIALLCSNQA